MQYILTEEEYRKLQNAAVAAKAKVVFIKKPRRAK